MRFLLVGRHRETGEVTLVSPDTYPTRQDALDRLGDAAARAGGLGDHELFMVDLDVAVPVVFYQAPTQQTEPEEEPIADVWDAPAAPVDELAELNALEDPVLEGAPPVWRSAEEVEPLAAELEAAADGIAFAPALEPEPVLEPEPEPEPVLWAAPDEPSDLADALRRAASRMESEGIVAPPNVEEVVSPADAEAAYITPVQAVAGDEASAKEPQAWPWETQPPVVATSGESATEGPAELAEGAEPAKTESGPDSAETDVFPTFQPVGIDEPGLEEVTLLTPMSVESFGIRPVVMGEYAEPGPDDDEHPFAALESLVGIEDAPEAEIADEGPASVPEVARAEEPDVEDMTPAAPGPLDDPVDAKGYEPGGTDLAAYTCIDCVYVSTCPKANQEGPATCGSFQWISV